MMLRGESDGLVVIGWREWVCLPELGIASLKAKVERWPLPSVWEDLESSRARDEVRWLRAFTGHADLP